METETAKKLPGVDETLDELRARLLDIVDAHTDPLDYTRRGTAADLRARMSDLARGIPEDAGCLLERAFPLLRWDGQEGGPDECNYKKFRATYGIASEDVYGPSDSFRVGAIDHATMRERIERIGRG